MADVSTLDGLFKEAYGDDILNLVPDHAILLKKVPYVPRSKENGKNYNQPVIVKNPKGVTYQAANSNAFTLNPALSMQMENAVLVGSQIVLRETISYEAAARAATGKPAFEDATSLVVGAMMAEAGTRLEIGMLHGGTGLGVGASQSGGDSTTTVIQVSTATWASGLWAGAEGDSLNFYGHVSGTLISTGDDSIFYVASVNTEDRQLTITGTSTGTTALKSAINSAGVDIYFLGAKANEQTGLTKQLTNTGSLFGISASDWSLWSPNQVTVSGQLTFKKVLKSMQASVSKGLRQKAICLASPPTWADLATDLAALRMYDSSYNRKELDNGAEALCYYGTNGKIDVLSHPMVMEGQFMIVPEDELLRIGASEITFNTPGNDKEGRIFRQLENAAGYELRNYSDQQIFLQTPALGTYITGFTNSAA